ncbi:response regulator transcription factor [Pararobbsia silviterrae]|uniref:DNA-binding response regulator n=1 Tax=Pararobbsia silviterrae TaxID=1792498 RepID=A0A494YCX9_9BURK|nr:response regulator transcription factor [Pararobbsia silviterrae]RKP57864.1 DNA-binding response regulator [Pararobbsia silviterrae]
MSPLSTATPALPEDKPLILIVDDTPDNLALLSDTLQAAGYAVLVALDGASALERLDLVTPDAVLLDAMMPDMDGFETCRLIKRDPRHRHLPIIFMTALTESEHVVQGFRVGGIDYVTKPVRPSEVVARIAAHVQRSQAQRQADLVLEMGMKAALIARGTGEIVWQSDLARQRIAHLWQLASEGSDALPAESAESAESATTRLPPALADWLKRWIDHGADAQATFETAHGSVRRIARVLGRASRGDWVILIDEFDDAAQTSDLAARFGLTAREAEVLLWLSRGKTNRDIGDIVGMAPRTVNKHLEHIFAKLNVETRAAATAMAVQVASR